VSAFSLAGDVLERGRELYMAPWGPFACSDGWVALIVATERDWGRFCEAIERPDLVGQEDVTTSGPERARNMDGELGQAIEAGSPPTPARRPRTSCWPPDCPSARSRPPRTSSPAPTSTPGSC
jgi:crotonobetainyl-CoA:carnitine CoA-transferase CaiB-like acyl-CoA transferase